MNRSLSLAAHLTVFALGITSAYAQSITRSTSPADPLGIGDRLEAIKAAKPGATPASGDDKSASQKGDPASREEAIAAIDKAIAVVRALRGAAEAGMLPTASPQAMALSEREMERQRVETSVADTPNEWTRALLAVQGQIGSVARSAATCGTEAAPTATLAVPTAWKDVHGVENWFKLLAAASCAIKGQLDSPWPVDADASTKAATFLPFAGFTGGNAAAQVSVQAADLYFTNRWRLYVRSTVQAKKEDDTATEAEDEAPSSVADQVDDRVRAAMLDPFGGALNMALGYYLKLPTPQLEGDANTADHGLFFDARGGMKLVELPEQTLTLGEGPSAVTPFFTGSAGLRLRLPTFLDRLSRGRAGAAELAAVLATTGIVDRGASALFSRTGALAPLPTRIHSLQVSLGIELDKIANIAISGNLWSNTELKKRVVVELNLVQPK